MTRTLTWIGATLGLALAFGGCDVEDADQEWRELEIAELERADADEELASEALVSAGESVADAEDAEVAEEDAACGLTSKSRELCIGQSVCQKTDPHGNTSYRYMPPEGCNANETEIPTGTVEVACGGANALTPNPNCPQGCQGPIAVSESADAKCCTVTKSCTPTPVPVDAEVVEG